MKNLRKTFLDIHIRNVTPKFENSRLNGVAVIAKTYTHTYIPTYTHTAELRLYLKKKILIDNKHVFQTCAVDVFSMGCVIYYALTAGQHPFGGRLERDLNIQNGRYKLPELNKTSKFISLVNSTYYVLNRYAFTMNCIILEDRNMGQLYTISIVKISRFASQTLIPDRRTLCLHSRPSGKLSFDCQKIAKN